MCAGEKELDAFKLQPEKFCAGQFEVPPPQIMMVGIRGSGTNTQLKILSTDIDV